ncbi:MAG: hypothetical protein AAFV88_15110 [Planctomycetota bacterium]
MNSLVFAYCFTLVTLVFGVLMALNYTIPKQSKEDEISIEDLREDFPGFGLATMFESERSRNG